MLRGHFELRHQRLREGPPLDHGAAALPTPRLRRGRGVVQRGAWGIPRSTEKPWEKWEFHQKNRGEMEKTEQDLHLDFMGSKWMYDLTNF